MSNAARIAYRYLSVLFLGGVVLEFFLAGLGVFRTQSSATVTGSTLTKAQFDHSFEPHLLLGDILAVLSILLVGVALLGRIGRTPTLTVVALLGLVLLQAALPFFGPSELRALHAVVALLVLGAALRIAIRARMVPGEASPITHAMTGET